jgi:GAF domain-containing protein
MKAHFPHTFRRAVRLLADVPQETLSRAAARFAGRSRVARVASPAPEHVMLRLENVFEALSDLPFQPHVAAALEVACDTLQAELPTETAAAGLYDIDSDELQILVVRSAMHDLRRGTRLPQGRGLLGAGAHEAVIARGDAPHASWLAGGKDSTALLCPILHDANLLGVLALANPLCAAQFDRDDLELVDYVAQQLSAVIQAHRHRTPVPFDTA